MSDEELKPTEQEFPNTAVLKTIRDLRYKMEVLQREAVGLLEMDYKEGINTEQEIERLTLEIEEGRRLSREYEDLRKSAEEFGVEVGGNEEFILNLDRKEKELNELKAGQSRREVHAATLVGKPGVMDRIHMEANREHSQREYERREKLKPLRDLANEIYAEMSHNLPTRIPVLGAKLEHMAGQTAWEIGLLLDQCSSLAEIEKIVLEPATDFLKDSFGTIRMLPEDIKKEILSILSQDEKVKKYFEMKEELKGKI